MKNPGTILVIDDDHFTRCLYADVLREDGHQVHAATSIEQAFALLRRHEVNLVVTDIFMPDMDGFEVLHYINDNYPLVDVIVTTGYADVDSAVRALKSGAKDYLRKPVNPEEFRLIVQRCLEQQSLFTEHKEFRHYLGLFEACNRISTCLEIDRLLPMSLHVLAQELHADEGLVLSKDPGYETLHATSLTIGGVLDLEELSKVYCEKLGEKNLLDCKKFALIQDPSYPESAKITLFLPIVIHSQVTAVFMLFFYKDSLVQQFTKEVLQQRTEFIGRQVALSYDNAVQFVQAREQAFVDDLTGLYNARYLSIVLERELKRSKRFDHNLSVLFMDLDRFKAVNDRYGHLIGSKLLVEVSEVLKSCLREIDTAVRYGGDEYTILLVNTDSHGAMVVAERIRQLIESRPFLSDEGQEIRISASIGIASYPEHAETVKELLDMADQAMYRGKNTSRNVVYIFQKAC